MNVYSTTALILSLTSLSVSVYILSQGVRKNLNRAFFFFSSIVFLNQFAHFILWSDIGSSHPIEALKFDALSWGLMGIAACDIAYAMTERKYGFIFKLSLLISIGIVITAIFTDYFFTGHRVLPWGIEAEPNTITDIAHGFSIGLLAFYAISKITYYRFRTKEKIMRAHLTYFLTGSIITFSVSLVTNILLAGTQTKIPPIGSLLLSIILGYILFSMIKYEFLQNRVENTAKQIFKDSHEVIILFNSNLEVIYVNNIAMKFFGEDISPGVTIHKLIPNFELKLQGSQEKTLLINEKEKILHVTISKYSSLFSAPLYILLARDITYKKKLMKIEYEKIKEQEVGSERSRFIANIQHEFMTPMHSILNFSRFGIKRTKDEKSLKYFSSINEAGNMLHDLLADLVEIAKIESGRQEYNFKKYDLRETISMSTSKFIDTMRSKKITTKIFITAMDTHAIFDSRMILKSLDKIMHNAIKYANEGTDITITIEESELMIDKIYEAFKISIKDYGAVIPEEEVEAVFRSFYESSNTQSDAGGIGVGLALCKKLINEHNGTIKAFSNYDENSTTIEFNIPKDYNKNSKQQAQKNVRDLHKVS